MVNIYLLSSYSQEAVAAVGFSNQLVSFINMLFFFITLGTAVVVSQNLGAEKEEQAASAVGTAVKMNISLGLILGLAVFLFHRPFLSLMGLTGQALEYTIRYFSIIGGLYGLQGLNLLLAAIMRNYGQAKAPMMVFLGINIFNVLGNTIIITRPFGMADLGLGGIAAWTAFSQACGSVAMVLCALRFGIPLGLHTGFSLKMAGEILRVGIPGGGDNFAYSFAQVCLTYFVTSLGTTALTAFTYATSLIAFVQILGYSVGQSAQILVGRHVGAGNFNAAYRLGFRATWIAMGLNLSVMAVLMIFQRPILRLFTYSEEVLAIIFWCFLVDLVLEFGRPFNLVIGVCVRGSGDVKWSIAASSVSILLVLIPLGYVFTQVIPLGVPGAFVALLADEWLRGQLMTMRWRSRKWEKAALVKPVAADGAEA